jgi:hypothetical protein
LVSFYTTSITTRTWMVVGVSGRQLDLMRQSRVVMDLDEDPLKVVGQVGMMTARRRGWSCI